MKVIKDKIRETIAAFILFSVLALSAYCTEAQVQQCAAGAKTEFNLIIHTHFSKNLIKLAEEVGHIVKSFERNAAVCFQLDDAELEEALSLALGAKNPQCVDGFVQLVKHFKGFHFNSNIIKDIKEATRIAEDVAQVITHCEEAPTEA